MKTQDYQKQFNAQLDRDLDYHIKEFLTKEEYADIKTLYRNNFDRIVGWIEKFGARSSIENIAGLDSTLSAWITINMLLLKEINEAITLRRLTKKDL